MINNHPVYSIVAVDDEWGIGKDGDLVWHFRTDMRYFAERTTATENADKRNMVVMGRTTWESIPEKYRPLRDRVNVVLTSQEGYVADGATVAGSLDEAFAMADETIETVYVIGGGRVYAEAMQRPELDGCYVTHIRHTYDCDSHFPDPRPHFGNRKLLNVDTENDITLEFTLYT